MLLDFINLQILIFYINKYRKGFKSNYKEYFCKNIISEKNLITYVFLGNNTVRAYAALHNINYSTAIFIKNNALKIMFEEINILNK
ncbi:hypothetical protein CNEO2_450015 [Clostridium neonatale]|nr:hypothetical protein CNEO2_450015 [Clostridium neonatale]CAI3680414.1 hypothetical protein CNEO2_450015 [Clostridium neonatale]